MSENLLKSTFFCFLSSAMECCFLQILCDFSRATKLTNPFIGLIYQSDALCLWFKVKFGIDVCRSNRGPTVNFFAVKRWNQTLLCMKYTISRNVGWKKFFNPITQILVDFSCGFYEEIQVQPITSMMMIMNDFPYRSMIVMLCLFHIPKKQFLNVLEKFFFPDFRFWPLNL